MTVALPLALTLPLPRLVPPTPTASAQKVTLPVGVPKLGLMVGLAETLAM